MEGAGAAEVAMHAAVECGHSPWPSPPLPPNPGALTSSTQRPGARPRQRTSHLTVLPHTTRHHTSLTPHRTAHVPPPLPHPPTLTPSPPPPLQGPVSSGFILDMLDRAEDYGGHDLAAKWLKL